MYNVKMIDMEMNVKEIFESLLSSLGACDNTADTVVDLGTYRLKAIVTDNGVGLFVTQWKEEPSEAPADVADAGCTNLRESFYEYLKTIDNDIFIEACKSLGAEVLRHLDHDIEANDYDVPTMEKAIAEFTVAIDEAIQKKISDLKSRMSYIPGKSN